MARAELYTKEAVLDYYRNNPCTMYRVYIGYTPTKTGCRYEYLEEDKATGEGVLSQALDAIEANKQNTNVYCLELIKEIQEKQARTKTITKEITSTCIGFQINFPNGVENVTKGSVGNIPVNIYNPSTPSTNMDFSERLFSMMEKQNDLIKQRLDDLQQQIDERTSVGNVDDDDDDDEMPELPSPNIEKSGADKVLGALAGILEREEVKSAAAAIIMGLATKFMPKE